MRALRYRLGSTRFFVAGEYGAETNRPHFHAILFGRTFTGSPCGKNIYSSPVLTALWPHGFSSFGAVTYQSAAYVAAYSIKKRTTSGASVRYASVDLSSGELTDLVAPFCHMSRNPGLGYNWFKKYWQEVYEARDAVVLHGGRKVPAPRYYDKLLEASSPTLRDYKDYERYVRSLEFVADSTPGRLLSRELCALASQKMKGRGL